MATFWKITANSQLCRDQTADADQLLLIGIFIGTNRDCDREFRSGIASMHTNPDWLNLLDSATLQPMDLRQPDLQYLRSAVGWLELGNAAWARPELDELS